MENSNVTLLKEEQQHFNKIRRRPPPIIIPEYSFTHKPITIITTKHYSDNYVDSYNCAPHAPKESGPNIRAKQLTPNKSSFNCFSDCFKYCI